jgi:hypothetical protein
VEQEQETKQTRRSVLGLAVAAAIGALAAAAGRAVPARAADGDPVIAGQQVSAESATMISSSSLGAVPVFGVSSSAPGATVLRGVGTGGGGYGVLGEAGGDRSVGVGGHSDVGEGVSGSSDNGVAGVVGSSPNTTGVYAQSPGDRAAALIGVAKPGGTALMAYSGYISIYDHLPAARPDTAVYAYANGAKDVPSAQAVGVYGVSGIGIGVYAKADTGTALYVDGRARFRRSGRVYVPARSSHVTVTMSGVTTSSWVIATPQQNRTGVFVQAVVARTGSFTIYLSKTVSLRTLVGYLVIN